MGRMYKRAAALALVLALLLGVWALAPAGGARSPGAAVADRGGYWLRAAVLYAGDADQVRVRAVLEDLRQSLVVNLEAEAIRAEEAPALEDYDLIFLDESLLDAAGDLTGRITAYVKNGGAVFCPNGFCRVFEPDFFGAKAFTPVEGYPGELHFPEVGTDLQPLQELVRDFHTAYGKYQGAAELRSRGYGMGLVPSTARPLVYKYDNATALYALNDYGKGLVFFTNPLLPNQYSASSFTLETEPGQAAFANTTASCNQLIFNEFAALVSRRIYGFSLRRVFGSYGSPAMSWELHYEDITAMEHDSLGQFAALAEDALQIPSLSVVRNAYTWFEQAETMAYALNGGSGALDFSLDRTESAYSSGTHVAAGDVWLKQAALEGCGSYFSELPGENYRLFPAVTDYDGDGIPDAFCGSADGRIRYYRGLGFTGRDGRLCVQPAVEPEGVSAEAFSAPACGDLDGDGLLDLLVGEPGGRLTYYRGLGDLRFAPGVLWYQVDCPGQCLPCLGDLDKDGVLDLALGSDAGQFVLLFGVPEDGLVRPDESRTLELSGLCRELELGDWLSPELCDVDADGQQELALGTFRGYVALLRWQADGSFRSAGFVDVADANYQGNSHLKFGTYCTPRFVDLNGDGRLDLLCGYEEYGMAYPIDSAYFPFRQQLQKQIDTALERHWYVGLHYLSGFYHTADREAWELETHKAALAGYGLTDIPGLNQHTWHLSCLDSRQSMEAMTRAGFLWQSGYEPSGALYRAPESAAENLIVLPFFLTENGERTLLIQNCSTLCHRGADWTDLSGKYRMPVLAYYHCDMIYKGDAGARKAIEEVNAFREKFGYSFVTEEQMMYAIAAAYNLRVRVEPEGDGFTLTPEAERTDFPLYDKAYQQACGVEITFAQGMDGWSSDADVGYTADGCLYLGLNRTVRVGQEAGTEALCLSRVNLPAEIGREEDGLTLRFLADGMAEVAVAGEARTDSPGWTVTRQGEDTVFTCFGENMTLHLIAGPYGES